MSIIGKQNGYCSTHASSTYDTNILIHLRPSNF
jgi:hypothetical protein